MNTPKVRDICELMHVSTSGNKCDMLTRLSSAILNPKDNLYINVIDDLTREYRNSELNDNDAR